MKQQRQQRKVTGYVTTTTSYWSWNRSKCRHSVDSSRVFNHNNSNNKTTATVRHRPQMCFSQQIEAVGYNNNIAELQRRIQAMEIWCYRKTLCISYKDHVTNEVVRAKVQQAIGPYKDLLTIVKRRKLGWYGHVSCSSGLAKTILQGTVKGGRRPGRQRKRWEDNIREWTGLSFAKSQRAVENREKWRKLVAKSSVVPQRPSQFRDR